jgi:hypothetical protein
MLLPSAQYNMGKDARRRKQYALNCAINTAGVAVAVSWQVAITASAFM